MLVDLTENRFAICVCVFPMNWREHARSAPTCGVMHLLCVCFRTQISLYFIAGFLGFQASFECQEEIKRRLLSYSLLLFSIVRHDVHV